MQWEYYVDPCYWDMWAIKPIDCKDFNKTFHVGDMEIAKELCNYLNSMELSYAMPRV